MTILRMPDQWSTSPSDEREREVIRWRRQDEVLVTLPNTPGRPLVLRTHLDHACERRTQAQRAALLQEAIDDLRAGTRKRAGDW